MMILHTPVHHYTLVLWIIISIPTAEYIFAWEQKSVHVSLGICKSKNALGDKEIVQGFATFIYFKGSIYFFVHLAKPKSHALS